MGNVYFVDQDNSCIYNLDSFLEIELGNIQIKGFWIIKGYENANSMRKVGPVYLFASKDKEECEYVYTHMTNCILEHRSMVYRHELYEDYKKRNGLV